MGARNYRDLIAWQKGMDLAVEVYRVTRRWPNEERSGLTDQARRAAVSVTANIAEGQGRNTQGDFVRFLNIAHGSLCEAETHLMLGQRLDYLDQADLDALLDQSAEVSCLIQGLLRKLRQSAPCPLPSAL